VDAVRAKTVPSDPVVIWDARCEVVELAVTLTVG